MSRTDDRATPLDRLRRHERGLVLIWLAFAGLGAMTVVGPIRGAVLDRAQAAVDWWEGRWWERLREGERLVRAGRFVEAQAHLERLDQTYPARNVRHARDQEREHLLRLLAQTYEALDRRTLTLQTYQRLVAFDPKHYRNYFTLGQASDRLLSRASMAVEARDAFAAALNIFPAHLPSVRGYIAYYVDQGQFSPIVEAYERYLDAFLIQNVEVRLGDAVVALPVQVDGRTREYEIPMSAAPSGSDVLTIGTGGFAVAIDRISMRPAIRAGVVPAPETVSVEPADVGLVDLEVADRGVYRPTGAGSPLHVKVPAALDAVGAVYVRLALFKPIDRELWGTVSKSYRNLLNDGGLLAATERTVVFESAEAADAVVERLDWARAGVLQDTEASDD
jgi:tetratricopeptide (TPR) repeat protein